MSTDEYTPSEDDEPTLDDQLADIRNAYAVFTDERIGGDIWAHRAEFDRFLARIRAEAKAEALREAVIAFGEHVGDSFTGIAFRDWLTNRAHQIEQEARG